MAKEIFLPDERKTIEILVMSAVLKFVRFMSRGPISSIEFSPLLQVKSCSIRSESEKAGK